MYTLVVTEKPSVAMSIAAVLDVKSRKDGYMEGGSWLISWCVGHLAELPDAETYDPNTPRESLDNGILGWELAT